MVFDTQFEIPYIAFVTPVGSDSLHQQEPALANGDGQALPTTLGPDCVDSLSPSIYAERIIFLIPDTIKHREWEGKPCGLRYPA